MIKQVLLNDWNFMRLFRLGFGITFALQAYMHEDKLMGFFSAIFLFQAFTNTGCCGSSGCAIPVPKKELYATEEVNFEEVKTK